MKKNWIILDLKKKLMNPYRIYWCVLSSVITWLCCIICTVCPPFFHYFDHIYIIYSVRWHTKKKNTIVINITLVPKICTNILMYIIVHCPLATIIAISYLYKTEGGPTRGSYSCHKLLSRVNNKDILED